jgi:hypothetical protein
MPAPNLPTLVAGDRWTAARYNALRAAIEFYGTPPMVAAYRTVAGSLTSGTDTLIGLDDEDYDTDGMHSVAAGPTNGRVYFVTQGRYEVVARCTFAAQSDGYRRIKVRTNSGGVVSGGGLLAEAIADAVPGDSTTVELVVQRRMVAGDYIEMFAAQNSGSGLALEVGVRKVQIAARYIGDA